MNLEFRINNLEFRRSLLLLLMCFCLSGFAVENGTDPKELAWKNDDPKYVEYLGKDVNARDEYQNQTPLHRAASNRKYNIVKALIEKGAKVNAKDSIDYTPLHWACIMRTNSMEDKKAFYNIAKLLIEHGANVNARAGEGQGPTLFSRGPKQKLTPLHMVCSSGENFEIVKLLVEHGANVNAKDYENRAPLHTAVEKKIWRLQNFFSQKEQE